MSDTKIIGGTIADVYLDQTNNQVVVELTNGMTISIPGGKDAIFTFPEDLG